jgi:hypothetical protein
MNENNQAQQIGRTISSIKLCGIWQKYLSFVIINNKKWKTANHAATELVACRTIPPAFWFFGASVFNV